MFNVAYHLHWGYDEMMSMPPDELLMFHALLVEQKDAEKEKTSEG